MPQIYGICIVGEVNFDTMWLLTAQKSGTEKNYEFVGGKELTLVINRE